MDDEVFAVFVIVACAVTLELPRGARILVILWMVAVAAVTHHSTVGHERLWRGEPEGTGRAGDL